MEKIQVLVTGATGLLGSHLLYFLVRSGKRVLAVKRSTSRTEDTRDVFGQYPDGLQLWQQVEWTEGDVLKKETLEEAIKQVDTVYHCAAVVSFTGADREKLKKTNLAGTENIASLCLKYKKRLCYVSSIAALGDARHEGEVIDENTPVIPGREHSEYSHSKSEAERIVWQYIHEGSDAVIVCPSIILGAGLWGRSSTALFMTVTKGIAFYTKGVSGYVDVRDVCELMIRLAEDRAVKGERFILNGGNHSYQELFTAIAHVSGNRPPRIYMRPWMTGVAWRLLKIGEKLTGKKASFTKETARSSHHKSFYSNEKIQKQYPDFHFYSLTETMQRIRWIYVNS